MLLFMEILYDMHCHVGFAPAPAAVAAEGAQAGIDALSCTVEPTEYEQLRAALADAPNVAVALGAHPWWIADGRVGDAELERFCELAPATRFIGEVGLDFAGPRNNDESRRLQIAALNRILDACDAAPATAETAGKLVSIHAVHAADVVLDLLHGHGTTGWHKVVFHWFSGTPDDLARAARAGCYFSIGPRMLASRRGREYARQIPLDHLLLETDMPSREGETLPANIWRAELGNALAGIAQLKNIDRDLLAERLAVTSSALLGTERAARPRPSNLGV